MKHSGTVRTPSPTQQRMIVGADVPIGPEKEQ